MSNETQSYISSTMWQSLAVLMLVSAIAGPAGFWAHCNVYLLTVITVYTLPVRLVRRTGIMTFRFHDILFWSLSSLSILRPCCRNDRQFNEAWRRCCSTQELWPYDEILLDITKILLGATSNGNAQSQYFPPYHLSISQADLLKFDHSVFGSHWRR